MYSRQILGALLLIMISGLLLHNNSDAAILNVPSTNYPTIKRAIVYAEEDDTILVSSGEYTGPGNRDLDFGRKALTLMSFKGPLVTKLNCQGTAADPHRVFRLHQWEKNTTIIQGFTITGGYAPPTGPDSLSLGGGIIVVNGSSPIIKDCIIENNFAYDGGGGVFCSDSAAPQFINCIIRNNSTPTANASETFGGGVLLEGSTPTFQNCDISNNTSANGGGFSATGADLTIINSQIRNNVAEGWSSFEPVFSGSGGGIYLLNSSLDLTGSEIYGNRAMPENQMNYYPGRGGGLFAANSPTTIENCTMVGNSAKTSLINSGEGGGVYVSGSSLTILNSIIAFSFDGEAIYEDQAGESGNSAAVTIACSDLYDNFDGDWVGGASGMENMNGNFSTDPMFCNIFSADFHLLPGSPCEPDYNECRLLIGSQGVGCATDLGSDGMSESMPFEVFQNYPNPFNPATTISYQLSKQGFVTIEIFNLLGQKIRMLLDQSQPPGLHEVLWDGHDNNNRAVASGIYLYQIKSDNRIVSKKMILMK